VTFDFSPDERALVDSWSQRLTALGHIYRYRSLSHFGRIADIVLRSEFYFPAYPKLNDPYDGRIRLDFSASAKQARERWERHFVELGQPLNADIQARIQELVDKRDDPATQAGLRDAYQAGVDELGVVCLSEPQDDIPMWAYYADSQQGVCLRFNAVLLMGLDGCFPPVPVSYLDQFPSVSFYNDRQFHLTRMSVATKSSAWEHEREWRLVRQAGAGTLPFRPAALDGIIMGCRIDPGHEASIRAIVRARTPPVTLFKARLADSEYRLIVEPA
jgi:hypothetical protein